MVKVSLIDLLLSFNYIVLFHYIVFMRASKKKRFIWLGWNRTKESPKKQKGKRTDPMRKTKNKKKKNTPRGRDGRFLGSNKAID